MGFTGCGFYGSIDADCGFCGGGSCSGGVEQRQRGGWLCFVGVRWVYGGGDQPIWCRPTWHGGGEQRLACLMWWIGGFGVTISGSAVVLSMGLLGCFLVCWLNMVVMPQFD